MEVKYTVLQLVQKVLSSIDGDEVTDINDTVESKQVVDIIQRCYNNLASRVDLPEDFSPVVLDFTSSDTPTMMEKPEGVDQILWVKYNKISSDETEMNFVDVKYLYPKEFFDLLYSYPFSDSNVDTYSTVISGTTLIVPYKNDKAPEYWTSLEDNIILFDSYDSDVDTYLKKEKTLSYGRKVKDFTASNSFVLPLDDQQFSLVLEDAIATAWAEMKQTVNTRAEKTVRNQLITLQRNKQDTPAGRPAIAEFPNYGRR